MGSISVGELKAALEFYPDDYEVVMSIHHKHNITKEEGSAGWWAYIAAVGADKNREVVELMNM